MKNKNQKWKNSEIELPKLDKNGCSEYVLVYFFGSENVYDVRYVDTDMWYPGGSDIRGTCWMPLPNKPKIKIRFMKTSIEDFINIE